VDQSVARDDLVRVQQQDGKQCSLARSPDQSEIGTVAYFEWSEDPELQ
jgi:hypothetical protein